MASGSGTISAMPSTWTQSPKNRSVKTHAAMRGSRRRLRTLTAVSRELTITRPSPSTPIVTGDSCGRPSDRNVVRTAREFVRRNSRARSASTLLAAAKSAEAAGGPLLHVLVHDRLGVRVGDVVLGSQPVHPLLGAQEARPVFEGLEPLGHGLAGGLGNARNELVVDLVWLTIGHRRCLLRLGNVSCRGCSSCGGVRKYASLSQHTWRVIGAPGDGSAALWAELEREVRRVAD